MSAATYPTQDDYIKLEKLGEGTYGVVYKAKHRKTSKVSCFGGQAIIITTRRHLSHHLPPPPPALASPSPPRHKPS